MISPNSDPSKAFRYNKTSIKSKKNLLEPFYTNLTFFKKSNMAANGRKPPYFSDSGSSMCTIDFHYNKGGIKWLEFTLWTSVKEIQFIERPCQTFMLRFQASKITVSNNYILYNGYICTTYFTSHQGAFENLMVVQNG